MTSPVAASRPTRLRRAFAWSVAAMLVVAVGGLAGNGLAAAPSTQVLQGIDSGLCAFPLGITLTSTQQAHQVGTGGVRMTGPSTVALQNLTTGQTSTLDASGPFSYDPQTGSLSWTGHEIWAGATLAPYLSTAGKNSIEAPNYVLSSPNDNATVIDPCALVGPAPSVAPVTTPAPWGLPGDALAHFAYAGLTPVLPATLVRHDHDHLDVIVNGLPVTIPAGIGLAEPTDLGPLGCPPGTQNGDCYSGDYFEGLVTDVPLHTHTTSGIIHIETDRPATFTLGQFFDAWGVRLTQTCVGGYCAGGGKELRLYVNGAQVPGDPRSLMLGGDEEIAVVYGGPRDFGSVPSAYPPGMEPGCGGTGEPTCF